MKKLVTVSAGIIYLKEEHKILVTERGYGEFKDKWEFPGGKIEVNESKEEALKRELKEEMDLSINIEKYLGMIEHEYDNFILNMHCFIVTPLSSFILKEHEAKKFVSLDELDRVDFLEADIKVIPLIKEYLKNND